MRVLVHVWFSPSLFHVNNESARTASYLITQQQPLEAQQIFNPTLVRDGIFSMGRSQDGDSSLQICGFEE